MKYSSRISRCLSLGIVVVLAGGMADVRAGRIYVDNRLGSDIRDGSAQTALDDRTGPVASIKRGLILARPGDTIFIVNNGMAYHESLELVGGQHDGIYGVPFQIIGNGAVVDGSSEIPRDAWKLAGHRLWKMTPWRKGFYQLVEAGKPIPEHSIIEEPDDLTQIPEGQWAAFKGSIYYRSSALGDPREMNLRFASHSVGISLYQVRGVFITDLTLRNFRLDGVNAHDLCRDVVLKDLVLQGNGRFGLFTGGTSQALLIGGEISQNRIDQIIAAGKSGIEVVDTVIEGEESPAPQPVDDQPAEQ